jgi:hypothetical protein
VYLASNGVRTLPRRGLAFKGFAQAGRQPIHVMLCYVQIRSKPQRIAPSADENLLIRQRWQKVIRQADR